MAVSIDRQDIESGFWHGVARASDAGLNVESIVEKSQHDEFITFLERAITDSGEWPSRAAKHIAENLTTFEIAWRNDSKGNSVIIENKKEEVDKFLDGFRALSNCWSHP